MLRCCENNVHPNYFFRGLLSDFVVGVGFAFGGTCLTWILGFGRGLARGFSSGFSSGFPSGFPSCFGADARDDFCDDSRRDSCGKSGVDFGAGRDVL